MAVLWLAFLVICSLLDQSCAMGGYRPQHVATEATLYRGNRPVVQLHSSNFSTLVGDEHAWVVEYYATWCGGCQRFAPSWKKLAADVRDWHHVVKVAALACSHPQNEEHCRQKNVTSYPGIRLFTPHAEETSIGKRYGGSEQIHDMRHGIVDFVASIGRNEPPNNWPKLDILMSSNDVHRYAAGSGTRLLIFLDETEDGYAGKEAALDLSSYMDQLQIRIASKKAAANYGITAMPSLYSAHSDGSLSLLGVADMSSGIRNQLVSLAKRHLGIESVTTTSASVAADEEPVSTRLPYGVHMQDIESGLYVSLRQEIPKSEEITGKALLGLRAYIHALAQLLPCKPYIRKYLQKLERAIGTASTLSSRRWLEILDEVQDHDSYLPERVIWTGCEGSMPKYRGYPCSLWTIFHSLTVGTKEQHFRHGGPHLTSMEVLLAIRGFIKHFFGCQECRQHFLKMSSNLTQLAEELGSSDDGLMWLWRAHNKVNNRLKEDVTEDPRHPKVQFPSRVACPACYRKTRKRSDAEEGWDAEEVRSYLEHFYSSDNVIEDQIAYNFTLRVKHPRSTVQTIAVAGVLQSPNLNLFMLSFTMVAWVPLLFAL